MGGGDQIDIGGTLFLKLQKDIGEACYADLAANIGLCDGMILAEYTAQIAAGEKHRAGAAVAGNTGLLPIVEGSAGNIKISGDAAAATLTESAVNAAAVGAEGAGFIERGKFRHHQHLQPYRMKVF